MGALSPPDSVRSAHLTTGWRRFQAESDRITDAFASATGSWDSAVALQRSSLVNLKLPKKPEV